MAPGTAAFLGPVSEAGFHFDGKAAQFGLGEILLAGVTDLECEKRWIASDAPVDLTLHGGTGEIEATALEATARSATTLEDCSRRG